MFREQLVAVDALRLFATFVQKLDPAAPSTVMPTDFKNGQADKTWTLRDILNYHAYDDAWIPDMLAGRTMAEVGETKWQGDLLADDPIENYLAFNESARLAVEKHENPDLIVHLSFGDYTARDYLLQVMSFRSLRVYDIARSLGMDTTLPVTLVDDLWDLLIPHADEWRLYGVYDPAEPVPENATPQQRLLATLGYAQQ